VFFLNKGGVGGLPFGVVFLNVHLVVLCANCSSHLSVQVLVFLLSSVVQICSPFYVFQIPLPTILDHHQTRNAYIMADIMGAKVITEDELDSSSLTSAVDEIFGMSYLNSVSRAIGGHSKLITYTRYNKIRIEYIRWVVRIYAYASIVSFYLYFLP